MASTLILCSYVLNMLFFCQAQVFLPTKATEDHVRALTAKLLDNTHFYHAKIPLALFLTSDFLQYARNGMIALSVEGGIDTHDIVCLDGKGKLVLSLTKDSFERFGITGVPSKFLADRQRHVVEIDLASPSLVPDKALYKRLKWCFENTLVTAFPMVLASVDPQGNSLPLEFPALAQAKRLDFELRVRQLENVLIPDSTVIRTIGKNDLCWRKNVSELYEWVGLCSIGSPRVLANDRIDPYLCVYSPPAQADNQPKVGSGCFVQITGLIPSQAIVQIFDGLRTLLENNSSSIDWSHFCVWGFQDSPISWRNQEHGYLTSGENMYSFFIWPSNIQTTPKQNQDSGVYVLIENVGAHDIHS